MLSPGNWDTEGGSRSTATELIDDYYGVSGNFFKFKVRKGSSPLTSYNVQGFSVWHLFENTQLPTNKNEKLTFTYYTDDISLTDNNEDFYMWVSSSFDAMYENYDILNDLLHGSYDQYYYGDDYTVKFATVKCDLVTDVTTTFDVYKCTSTVEFDLNKFKPIGESLDIYDFLFFGYTSNSNFSPGAIAFVNELNYECVEITPTPTPTPTPPDLSDTITDPSVDFDSSDSFFNNFEDNDYGLSDIITLPLQFIQNLTSNTCQNLVLPLPFVNQNLTLPCMNSIYQEYFGSFFTMYQAITTGLIGYWVAVRIYALVKGFKDPEDDKIEVMDL